MRMWRNWQTRMVEGHVILDRGGSNPFIRTTTKTPIRVFFCCGADKVGIKTTTLFHRKILGKRRSTEILWMRCTSVHRNSQKISKQVFLQNLTWNSRGGVKFHYRSTQKDTSHKKQIYFTNKIHHAKQKIGGASNPQFFMATIKDRPYNRKAIFKWRLFVQMASVFRGVSRVASDLFRTFRDRYRVHPGWGFDCACTRPHIKTAWIKPSCFHNIFRSGLFCA